MFVGYIAHVHKCLRIKFVSMYTKVVIPLKAQVTRNVFFFFFFDEAYNTRVYVNKTKKKRKINAVYTIATTIEILMRKTKQF